MELNFSREFFFAYYRFQLFSVSWEGKKKKRINCQLHPELTFYTKKQNKFYAYMEYRNILRDKKWILARTVYKWMRFSEWLK